MQVVHDLHAYLCLRLSANRVNVFVDAAVGSAGGALTNRAASFTRAPTNKERVRVKSYIMLNTHAACIALVCTYYIQYRPNQTLSL